MSAKSKTTTEQQRRMQEMLARKNARVAQRRFARSAPALSKIGPRHQGR